MYKPDKNLCGLRVKRHGEWMTLLPHFDGDGFEPDTVSRPTGQLDIDQKHIFEGDILECDLLNEFGSATPGAGVMIYKVQDGRFILDLFSHGTYGGMLEVINSKIVGDIYSNPELIKKYSDLYGTSSAIMNT